MYQSKSFFEYEPDELDFIPFDIETTGFKSCGGDFITVFVLHHHGKYHIWLNTDGDTNVDINQMYDKIRDGSQMDNFIVYICDSEKTLLENVNDYLESHTTNASVLTAFNGETYGDGDFDVPFLRTRCARASVPWIFKGFWYTDSYEILSKKNRFDTTIKAEPSLEGMKKSDLKQFVDDTDSIDVHYNKMKKAEIIQELENHDGVTETILESWVDNNGITGVNPANISSFTRKELETFIDDKSLNIPYNKLSTNELIREIRNQNYTEDMLVEWHKETGRSIGTTEVNDLDGIHEVMIEEKLTDAAWRNNVPFELEMFDPFDPYNDSGEAVEGYNKGDYVGVILHCFADVARTVNLTRMMAEYAPQEDYKPKVL